MFENTTGGNVNYWSHQSLCNVWKYNKIAGNRGNLNYWSHQLSGHVWIQQDSRQATNHYAMCENTTRLQATGGNWSYWSHHVWKYNKIPGNRPVSLLCLKIQQDCGQWGEHLDYWRHQIFCIVWDDNKKQYEFALAEKNDAKVVRIAVETRWDLECND